MSQPINASVFASSLTVNRRAKITSTDWIKPHINSIMMIICYFVIIFSNGPLRVSLRKGIEHIQGPRINNHPYKAVALVKTRRLVLINYCNYFRCTVCSKKTEITNLWLELYILFFLISFAGYTSRLCARNIGSLVFPTCPDHLRKRHFAYFANKSRTACNASKFSEKVYLWGFLKDDVNHNHPRTTGELKE